MPRTTNQISRTALVFGLAGVLMAAGCNGARTYSLSGGALDAGGGGQEPGDGAGGGSGDSGGGGGSGNGSDSGGSGGGSGGESGSLGGLAETTGLDDAADPLGRVTVGDRTVLGQQGGTDGVLGVSALSPMTEAGDVATVGVLSGGQVAGLAVGQPNSATAPATGAANGLLGVTVGDQQVGASNPAIDLNVLAPTGAAGAVAGVDVLSNGQPLNATVNNPGAAQTPVSGVVDAVTGTVGGVVSAVPNVGANAGADAGSGGVGAAVGGVVGGLTAGLGGSLGLGQPK